MTFSKKILHEDAALIPNLSSFLPFVKPKLVEKFNNNYVTYCNSKIPGVFVGTINADTPLCPLEISERAITIIAPPSIPLVTQALVPFSIQLFPSRFAIVVILTASLPLPNLKIIHFYYIKLCF